MIVAAIGARRMGQLRLCYYAVIQMLMEPTNLAACCPVIARRRWVSSSSPTWEGDLMELQRHRTHDPPAGVLSFVLGAGPG